MKLCGLYARVSTERQSNIRDGSLDTQISRLKTYVDFRKSADQDWKVVKTYREGGKSGKDTDRPALHELMADVRDGTINAVIVTKIDRITRSLLDFYKLVETFEQCGAEFISLEENFDTSSPMGKAMLKITLVFAELEREQTSKRTADKMAWRAQQGLWNGGHILGYDLIDKKLVVNKDEAKLVRLIFDKYLALGSLKAVSDYLNNHGYRTKKYRSKKRDMMRGGEKFFVTIVKQKLTNELYIGRIKHKDKTSKGQHKPIIDMKLWNAVQRCLSRNMPSRRNVKAKKVHTFTLQGLIECGWCHSYLTPKYSTGRSRLHPYYQCTRNSRFGKHDCQMKYVPAEELEKLVTEQLKKMSQDKKLIQDVVAKTNKDTDKILEKLRQDRKVRENTLRPVKVRIDNLIEAVASGKGLKKIGSVNTKLLELEQRKDEIEKDIQNIIFEADKVKVQVLNAKVMHESLKRFSQICDKAKSEELKELIPCFVEKIIWTPSEIKIALFDQPVQRGQINGSETTYGSGAPQISEWLPR